MSRSHQSYGPAALLAAILAVAYVSGATFYVDVAYDQANGVSDGSSTRPFTNLTAAVAAANAQPTVQDEIYAAAGIYRSILAGGAEDFGVNGIEMAGRGCRIYGGYAGMVAGVWDATRNPRETIIDLAGAGTRAFHLTLTTHQGNAPLFDGLTFRNADHALRGGAINHNGGWDTGMRINDCLFTNNLTTSSGGAVYFQASHAGSSGIWNSDFIDNQSGGAGGAVQAVVAFTTHYVTNCLFSRNQAGGNGGALFVVCGANSNERLIVQNGRFEGNSAVQGGAVFSFDGEGTHPVRFDRCAFVANSCSSFGAAVGGNDYWHGEYELFNCLIVSNTGSYAVYANGHRVSLNTAAADIRHCTIADNPGGGVYVYNARGGSATAPTLSIQNSIIANNGAVGVHYGRNNGLDALLEYNNVQGHTTNYAGNATPGPGSISTPAGFVDPPLDYRLGKDSACIDTGTDLGITVDLDGVTRPTRLGFDMGCYEEWQIPIIASRAAVAEPTAAEVRAEFLYESEHIATYAFFVLDTADRGTTAIGDWWQSAAAGEQGQGLVFGAAIAGLTPNRIYWYRCVASNDYDVIWGPAAWFRTPAAGGVTREWLGTGGNDLASNPANWDGGVAPSATDYVLLDRSISNLTWDAAAVQSVARWTQTENYTGTVTFETTDPAYDATFTNFTISGDATVSGGAWTHVNQPAIHTQQRRLQVAINGDLLVGAAGSVTAEAKGFPVNYGPGQPGGGGNPAHGGSHGGLGGFHVGTPNNPPGPTYGSITAPTTLGSGAGPNSGCGGGGAILLTVNGTLTVDGTISVIGASTHRATGAGGSLFIRAGRLAGAAGGWLRADGGPATESGGSGGRVAVVLSAGDFSAFGGRMNAFGSGNVYRGAAGTIYRQAADQADGRGILILDNDNGVPHTLIDTRMPPDVDLNRFDAVIITNRATLGVAADTTLDFGAARLLPAGAQNAFIKIVDPTLTAFPDPYILSGYTLIADGLTAVTGNWTIADDGILTHRGPVMSSTLMPPDEFRIDFTLDGDLTVASGGGVRADALGYMFNLGPGRPTGSSIAHAASYGGVGGYHYHTASGALGPTYGSIIAPTALGSGGGANGGTSGGGAIRLDIRGALTVEAGGLISANGGGYRSGSGGSVYLEAATLSGAGIIRANGGNGESGGGGGRVAVILSASDFSTYTGAITAFGGQSAYAAQYMGDGAAGTVFLQWPAGAVLRVVNFSTHPNLYDGSGGATGEALTDIRLSAAQAGDLRQTTLSMAAGGPVRLMQDTTIADLFIDPGGLLDLNFFICFVKSIWHPFGPAPINPGRLVWIQPSVFMVR